MSRMAPVSKPHASASRLLSADGFPAWHRAATVGFVTEEFRGPIIASQSQSMETFMALPSKLFRGDPNSRRPFVSGPAHTRRVL